MRYRKKPVIIEAIYWDGSERAEKLLVQMAQGSTTHYRVVTGYGVIIQTLEGEMTAGKGDYVLRGVAGELYPCKPKIFEATYESVT